MKKFKIVFGTFGEKANREFGHSIKTKIINVITYPLLCGKFVGIIIFNLK